MDGATGRNAVPGPQVFAWIRKVLAHRTAINTMVGIAISGYSLAASSLSDHTGRTGADIFSHERRTLYLSLSSSPDGTSLDNYCCVYGDPVLRVRRSS